MFRLIYVSRVMITFMITSFFVSCGGGGEKTGNDTSSDSALKTNQEGNDSLKAGAKTGSLSGYLNTLWTDSGTFNKAGRRIVFRFYTKTPDSLTLNGWTTFKADTFQVPPVPADIPLHIGVASNIITYGTQTYFGNLVLQGDDRREITRKTRHHPAGPFKYVLFVPLNPQDPAQAHQITYEIKLTNDDPSKVISTSLATTPTNVALNPSPPRNPH